MKLTRRILMGAAAGSFLLSAGAAMAKTELTFWSWRQEDRAFYQDIIRKFQEKEPDISVKFETYAPENYQTILSTALAAGRGPDVIQVRAYGNLEAIATPGYLHALIGRLFLSSPTSLSRPSRPRRCAPTARSMPCPSPCRPRWWFTTRRSSRMRA